MLSSDVVKLGNGETAEDFMHKLKAKHWRSWFDQEVPRLQHMSPREASKTKRGRTLLNNLLAFYDECRKGRDDDCNVPTAWVKWKLGYGPGSAQEFAREEAIYNQPVPTEKKRAPRTKECQVTLEKKMSKKCFYIPLRCEALGCQKAGRSTVKDWCSKCNSIYYCGRDHQVQDWPRHKLECKYLAKSGLHAKTYVTEEELKKYPINCFPMPTPASGTPLKCFVCGSEEQKKGDIGFTECCNMPVCDDESNYQLLSYSREFCMRSHHQYTACNSHYQEEHQGDWRECPDCNRMKVRGQGVAVRPFALTNRFNVTPPLESSLPQGSFLSGPCDTPGCKRRILPGHDGITHRRDGTEVCGVCVPEYNLGNRPGHSKLAFG